MNVYGATDVLYMLFKVGLIIDFVPEVKKYTDSTKHTYTKDILGRYGVNI